MEEQDIIRQAKIAYDEARSAITEWNSEATTDLRFYLSDQWDDKDAAALRKKGVPVLNLNYIKKTIDLVAGYQRQNRSDLKFYPIENGDSLVAEMISRISMWVMKNNHSRFYISDAFKDAIITGVGWIYPEIDYSRDPLNGDVMIKRESPFNILFDPYLTNHDLSDCSYIIRHKLVNKKIAKNLWPDKKEEIDALGSAVKDQSFRQDPDVPSDSGNMVLVWEYWYRCTEKKEYAILETGELLPVDEEEKAEMMQTQPDLEVIEKDMPIIKVAIMVGQSTDSDTPVLVFHGDSPVLKTDFHFIPIFAYLTSTYSLWQDKLQGMIRSLRDAQREKNKRRSAIMHALNTVASSGYDIEKGAYDDISQFATGGPGKIYRRNRGFAPAQRIPAPEMPSSFIQLEQMFTNDINVIGANPDLLGQISEKGAAGITIQLRQKQGMTALQEVFDNLSLALQRVGRMLVEIIVDNFTKAKVERILGEDIPYAMDLKQLNEQAEQMKVQLKQMAETMQQLAGRQTSDEQEYMQMDQQEKMFEEQMMQMNAQYEQVNQQIQMLATKQQEFWKKWGMLEKESRYDCSVSEAIENETYRIATLSALMQAQQYGAPVPPELLLEYLDIPQEDKARMVEYVKQQQDAQMQMQQQKIQIEQQKVNDQKEIEMIKQGINPQAVKNQEMMQ